MYKLLFILFIIKLYARINIFKDFLYIYKKCTPEKFFFLVNDTTLPSHNPLRFRKNLLK